MKPKSLIKQYLNDPEARAFIEKHKRELKPHTYECDELSHFKPVTMKIEDITVVLQNLHLLTDPKHQAFMRDYFKGMSYIKLTEKYGYANKETTRTTVQKFKKTIFRRYKRKMDEEFAFEMKKVSVKYLEENRLSHITIDLQGKPLKLNLIKVLHKHKLNYKYTDEDCLTMRNKFDIVKKYCSHSELKKIAKMGDLADMKPHQFNFVAEVLNRFRWVNDEGYLLNKNVDDALTDILAVTETRELPLVLN